MTKIKSLVLRNFQGMREIAVSFDDAVTYICGPNGAGKSTAGHTGVQFILGGIAQVAKDGNKPLIGERFRFIGEWGVSTTGNMILSDTKFGCEIVVKRKVTKDSSTVTFEAPQGIELNQQWLNDLFNEFLLCPKKFMQLSPKEHALMFGINVDDIDDKIAKIKSEYTLLNRDLGNIPNELEPEKVQFVDIKDVILQKQYAFKFNEQQKEKDDAIGTLQRKVENARERIASYERQIEKLNQDITDERVEIINLNTKIEESPKPEDLKSIAILDSQIDNASISNFKANIYSVWETNQERYEKAKEKVEDNRLKLAEAEQERLGLIKKAKLPFKGMTVNDKGELLYDGRPIKEPYFSTGQLIKMVPVLLSTLNPELKYIYIQDFNLLDEENQKSTIEYLTKKGFQLVIEYVGKPEDKSANIITLKNCKVEDE